MNNDPGLFFTNLYVTPVLRNISLYLEKGKMLAVAGSTGAGKVSQTLLCTLLSQIIPKEPFSIVELRISRVVPEEKNQCDVYCTTVSLFAPEFPAYDDPGRTSTNGR